MVAQHESGQPAGAQGRRCPSCSFARPPSFGFLAPIANTNTPPPLYYISPSDYPLSVRRTSKFLLVQQARSRGRCSRGKRTRLARSDRESRILHRLCCAMERCLQRQEHCGMPRRPQRDPAFYLSAVFGVYINVKSVFAIGGLSRLPFFPANGWLFPLFFLRTAAQTALYI